MGSPKSQTLLESLRGVGQIRPTIDEFAAARIRAELEEAVGAWPRWPDGGSPLRVTKTRLRQVLTCERHLVACLDASDPPTSALVAGRLADLLFGLVAVGHPLRSVTTASPLGPVTVGTPGWDLVTYALAAATAAGQERLGFDWAGLSSEQQAEAASIVESCRGALEAWPVLPSSALVRLQEPLRAELSGGHVVLTGRVDLVLGRATPLVAGAGVAGAGLAGAGLAGAGVAGATLVDVKSGRRRQEDRADAGWYAVLETLRHRAPPFQVGTYYLRDGELELDVVTAELMAQASARIAQGLASLARLAHGGVAHANPNPLCPWCPAIASCVPGRRFSFERGDLIGPVDLEDKEPDAR
ncbi:MAG: hypothetical protein ACRDX8_01440 [Acidimicrobiales bacterium]